MSEPAFTSSDIQIQRPAVLTLFCILSFIANGFMILSGLTGILSSGYIAGLLEQYAPGNQLFGHEMLLITSFSVVIIFGLKMWGVILMFFGRKSGYIMYLIPTGMLMILNVVLLFSKYSAIATAWLLISIVFIVIYSIFLKYMK
jgi:hypothetical protein